MERIVSRALASLTLALSLLAAAPSRSTQPAPTDEARSRIQAELAKLPPPLAQKAREMLSERDVPERAKRAGNLARRDPAALTEFMLAVLAAEPSVDVRISIVESLGDAPTPRIRQALSDLAASDADFHVSLSALERLRFLTAREERDLLQQRLDLARRAHDDAGFERLAAEQERWTSVVLGTMLPSFMRVPPPCFAVKPDRQPIRFLAFGDFGAGTPAQRQAAAAMADWNRKTPFDFGVTLGDNFYERGMSSPSDARWKSQWDTLYDPLGIKIFASLGNHDWGLSDSPAAEILYSERSPSWRMPASYYTFTAGPAQFFALDTSEVSEAQLLWLDAELKKSALKWKVVYGHHPIYSDGPHGDNPELIKRLLPLLQKRVDLYLAGHDHIFDHIKADGLEFFTSGGGGAVLNLVKGGPRSQFARSAHGFTIVDIDANEVRVRFIGADSKQLYAYAIRK